MSLGLRPPDWHPHELLSGVSVPLSRVPGAKVRALLLEDPTSFLRPEPLPESHVTRHATSNPQPSAPSTEKELRKHVLDSLLLL